MRRGRFGGRNLSDDQRAMNAATLADLQSQRAKHDRAKAGRAAGGDATTEQKANRLSADVVPKRSDRGNLLPSVCRHDEKPFGG